VARVDEAPEEREGLHVDIYTPESRSLDGLDARVDRRLGRRRNDDILDGPLLSDTLAEDLRLDHAVLNGWRHPSLCLPNHALA